MFTRLEVEFDETQACPAAVCSYTREGWKVVHRETRQWNAINAVLERVREHPAVRAAFLKGSLARGEGDEWSDIDFYCLVYDERMPQFLEDRLNILQAYRPLLFWSHANFVGPQVVAVYDDGLHFDLYTVTEATLKNTDAIKVLYDPEGILRSYRVLELALTPVQAGMAFNSFSFSLLEFEAAFRRNDFLWASRLASHLTSFLAQLFRYLYQREQSQLGFKNLSFVMPVEVREQMQKAMDMIGPSFLPDGVTMIVRLAEEVYKALPEDVRVHVNEQFFRFMKDKIVRLK